MSDYDNSVSHYALELGVSERQVRRYCRHGFIPSAELMKGRTGRPKWRISDTSPKAVQELRNALMFQRFDPPTFCEPMLNVDWEENSEGKLVPTKLVIRWRPVYVPPIRDRWSLIVVRARRAALLQHGMTEGDIRQPPLCKSEQGLFYTFPPHDEKIRSFEQTETALFDGLFEPAGSAQHKWAHRVLSEDLRQSDITQAAERLAIFHSTYKIEITYRSLAQVLGVSKSSLYRTYPGLIKQALWLAKRKAASGLESKKAAFGLESASKDGDLHAYSLLSRKVPHDLPVEHLYDAILKLSAAGKPIDERSIYLALRRQGVLAEGEKLFDYFDSTCVANVVRAVTDPQGPPAHQKTPRCAAA